jgi:hypothetical protein
MYPCMHTYECMCVCIYMSTYVCICVCMYVCMYACMFTSMYVCMYVYAYVCLVVGNLSSWFQSHVTKFSGRMLRVHQEHV